MFRTFSIIFAVCLAGAIYLSLRANRQFVDVNEQARIQGEQIEDLTAELARKKETIAQLEKTLAQNLREQNKDLEQVSTFLAARRSNLESAIRQARHAEAPPPPRVARKSKPAQPAAPIARGAKFPAQEASPEAAAAPEPAPAPAPARAPEPKKQASNVKELERQLQAVTEQQARLAQTTPPSGGSEAERALNLQIQNREKMVESTQAEVASLQGRADPESQAKLAEAEKRLEDQMDVIRKLRAERAGLPREWSVRNGTEIQSAETEHINDLQTSADILRSKIDAEKKAYLQIEQSIQKKQN